MRKSEPVKSLDILNDPNSWEEFFRKLPPEKQQEFARMAGAVSGLAPMPGPQSDAFLSTAKIVGYGGSGGGGKTSLIILLALLRHRHSVVFRYDKQQLSGLINDLIRLRGSRQGLNRQEGIFQFGESHYLQFGGLGKPDQEENWQGIAHDLIAYDEVTQLPQHKIEYTMGWARTVLPNQPVKILMTFNPPRSPVGRWVIPYFAPWLDRAHPDYPAKPGRIYWYHRNEEDEVVEHTEDPGEVTLNLNGQAIPITAETRTFFPARVWHNQYLVAAGYHSHLANRPKVERDMLLLGDFNAAIQDDDYQLVPTSWVEEAMTRWEPRGRHEWPMDALGVDISRRGDDRTVITRRHRLWFDKQSEFPGREMTSGVIAAQKVLELIGNQKNVTICVDSVGDGASAYDVLNDVYRVNPVGIKGQIRQHLPRKLEAEREFYNLRSVLAWTLRRLLDPANGLQVQIPPSPKLRDEIIAHHYQEKGEYTQVETKDSVKETLHHSPDLFDSLIYSLYPIAYRDEDVADRIFPKGRARVIPGSLGVKRSRIFNPYSR